MLNRVILMGRITHDLEVRQTPTGVPSLTFTVAVERSFVRQGEERQSDFIRCVAWRQTAEFIARYFGKGRMIAIEGNLRTSTYDDKNGTKHYVTDVYVDNASFTGEPKQGGNSGYSSGYSNSYSNQNQSSAPRQSSAPAYNEPSQKPIAIGDLDDFEEILGDDGVPF